MPTNAEHIANLVANAAHRVDEVYQYQVNVDNYTVMLAALPTDEWPAHLAQYAAVTTDKLPWNMSDEDVDAVSDYQYRDRLRQLLRSERVEQGKARRVLEALKVQIGPDADRRIEAAKNASI